MNRAFFSCDTSFRISVSCFSHKTSFHKSRFAQLFNANCMTKSTEVDNKNVYELLFLFEADVKLIQRLEKEKPKRNKVFNRGKKKN